MNDGHWETQMELTSTRELLVYLDDLSNAIIAFTTCPTRASNGRHWKAHKRRDSLTGKTFISFLKNHFSSD
ncbi:hypothetical protein OAG82_00920 [Rubripirellula sp.]|nr:hypothetical protein [Rubripirellula sp.]